MAKKDFSNANTNRVYGVISEATAPLDDFDAQRLEEIEQAQIPDDYAQQRYQEQEKRHPELFKPEEPETPKENDPAAGKQGATASWTNHKRRTTKKATEEKKTYPRYNIYVPSRDIYEDFAIYAKDIGMNTSALIAQIMEQIVTANREQIEEAKKRHAKAQQKKYE